MPDMAIKVLYRFIDKHYNHFTVVILQTYKKKRFTLNTLVSVYLLYEKKMARKLPKMNKKDIIRVYYF